MLKSMKIVVLLTTTVLATTVLFTGCSSTPAEPEKVDKSIEQPPAVEEVTQEIFKVGDTVSIGDFEFTLNSVRFDKGSEYFKPDEGKVWLVIDGTLTNKSSESAQVSSMLMFKLYDNEHYSKDMEFMVDTKGALDGELGAGRSMRGELAYSVSTTDEYWELIFENDVFGKGQAIFKINPSDIK